MKQPKPGDKYMGAICHNTRCQQFIGITPVPKDTKAKDFKVEGPGTIRTKCPACGETGVYETRELYVQEVPPVPRPRGRPPVS